MREIVAFILMMGVGGVLIYLMLDAVHHAGKPKS